MPSITAYANNILLHNQEQVKCALGMGGVAPEITKREGDGASPEGVFPIRRIHVREDRVKDLKTALPTRTITPDDLWCDALDHPDYNRLITHPLEASHERLWRDDHVYDIIVELGFNDDPPIAGRGSAIFFHIARANYTPTRGCIAVSMSDMLRIVADLKPGDQFEISRMNAPGS